MDQYHATRQIGQDQILFLQIRQSVWQSNEMRLWLFGSVDDNVALSILYDSADASAPESFTDPIKKLLCQICSTIEASKPFGVLANRQVERVMGSLTLASAVSGRLDFCAIDVESTFAAITGNDCLTC